VRRRTFSAASAAALAWPIVAKAQSAGRVYRVAVLRPSTPEESTRLVEALRGEGYVQGKNLVIDNRWASGNLSLLPSLMQELVNARPDVVLAVGQAAVRAAIEARSTIPIIMFANLDPVALGLVPNLARPGGDVTGVLISSEGTFAGKKLELLKEAVPHSRRIALLIPDDPGIERQVKEVQDAATALDVDLVVAQVQESRYEEVFGTIAANRAGALFVAGHNYFFRDRKPIIELAERYRLPAMYEWPDQVREGGLMAYGANQAVMFEQIADYMDRIFKGTKVGDLPFVMPTKLHLALNLRTAKAIGYAFPPSLLARADELVE
jgi:putative ABC transport system substrate-binding protein